jgi:hypothetical protein
MQLIWNFERRDEIGFHDPPSSYTTDSESLQVTKQDLQISESSGDWTVQFYESRSMTFPHLVRVEFSTTS